MSLFRNKYRVESTRLPNWDYSSNGFYFVTIVTKNREKLFGHIKNNQMILNDFGKIVEQCWFDLPNHYVNCKLDAFIIMPDHVHGIIEIDNSMIIGNKHGLSEFVRAFKTFSSRGINELRVETGLKPVSKNDDTYTIDKGLKPVSTWQSRFYDSIIRDDFALNAVRNYIIDNPKNAIDDDFE